MNTILKGAIIFALIVLSSFGLIACPQPPKAPCATDIVVQYTAEMIAAGCKGEHFNDAQCAPIKAKRDAAEAAAGCK